LPPTGFPPVGPHGDIGRAAGGSASESERGLKFEFIKYLD